MNAELYPQDRLAKAAAAAERAGVDALLLTPGADLRYLTGYAALPLERLTCLAVPVRGEPVLVVPQLEAPAAAASPAGGLRLDLLAVGETDDAYALLAQRLRAALGSAPRRVALANRMWAEQHLRLVTALGGPEVALASAVLRDMRVRKSPAEVAELRAAGAAIDRVHARMGEWLHVGRTEQEVGRDIAAAIVEEGHATVNFVIVAAGPDGASPHHATGPRRIEPGDPVVVDIGGTTAAGYCSDATRTYVVGGEPPADFAAYYRVLQEAQEASCAAVRPGVRAEAVDAAAREPIAAAGYGEWFVHRTGHGIGLEEHEEPYIVAGNADELEPGMCFSVEPGIYAPGRHGARIEDIVVVTAEGVERLNRVSRELVCL